MSYRPDRDRRRSRSRSGGRERDGYRSRYRRDEPGEERRHKSRDRQPYSQRSRSPHRRRDDSRERPDKHHKRRSRSRSRERDREKGKDKERRRKRSRSASDGSSSDSGSERDRRKERKEGKEERRKQKEERRERKREKKEKKKKRKAVTEWGKYGVISETDMYNKEAEYRTWLVEERLVNPETISKEQNKKEFARFIEDYNTATLPHKKYYDMAKYERRMDYVRGGETIPPDEEMYDPNRDMLAHAHSLKKNTSEKEVYLSKEQLKELRRVQQERFEIGKRKALGLEIKSTMGVRMEEGTLDLEDY